MSGAAVMRRGRAALGPRHGSGVRASAAPGDGTRKPRADGGHPLAESAR
jgi:hypothetical protein